MTPSCDFVAPIRRSKEIKAVCAALNTQLGRGVIRGFQEGKLRVGRMNIDVEWPDTRVSRLRIDIEAATLTFTSLLETNAGSPLFKELLKELKTLVRVAQGQGSPARAMLRLTEQAGNVSLAMTVTSGEYEYCTRRLLDLAQQALALLPAHLPLESSYQPAAVG